MAYRVWKDSWAPGDYVLLDGRPVSYTAREIAQGVRRLKALVKAGWYVPLADGHALENQPRPASQLAQDLADRLHRTFGQVVDARQRPDGVAEFLCEVHDDRDKDLLRQKPWVSPQLHESWPPEKPVWRGPTPTHLAVCEQPIWTGEAGQRAFQLSRDRRPRPPVVQLGLAKRGAAMAEGEDKDTDTGGGDMDTCPPAIVDALRESGMSIPEEAKTVNEVVVAIKASMTTPEEALPEEPVGAEAPPPPVTMSADAVRLSAEVAQLRGQLRRQKYDQAEKDIRGLTLDGNLEPHKRDAWLRELKGAVQMSADGGARADVPVGLLARIEARKDLPKDSIFDASGTRKTAKTEGHEAPTPPDALDDEAQADKDVDAYVARRQGQRQRA